MPMKCVLLALTAIVVLGLSTATASANWFKHHSVIQEDEEISFTGQTKLQLGVFGSIECQVHGKVTLLAGQTAASVEDYGLDMTPLTPATDFCVTAGPLGGCDVTDLVTDATTESPWNAQLTQNRDTIEISTGTSQYLLEATNSKPGTHHACSVVQAIQLKPGKVHWTVAPEGTCTVNTVTESGSLQAQTGSIVATSGTLNVIPAPTYGTEC